MWLLQVEVIDLAHSQASNNVPGSCAGTAAATQQMSMGAPGAAAQLTLLGAVYMSDCTLALRASTDFSLLSARVPPSHKYV